MTLRAAILAALLCTACGVAAPGPTPSANVAPPAAVVSVGMTPAQVRAALGEPDRAENEEGEECWYYRDGTAVLFRGGSVAFRGRASAPAERP